MKFLKRIFNFRKEDKREIENENFDSKVEKINKLFEETLADFNKDKCQCYYPEFHELISIDCVRYEKPYAFLAVDTELLINNSKKYFIKSKSSRDDEDYNEKWTCNKCQSVYEYGRSEFSIHLYRQKLELTNLKVNISGINTKHKTLLFLGVQGHTYPNNKFKTVSFETFKNHLRKGLSCESCFTKEIENFTSEKHW